MLNVQKLGRKFIHNDVILDDIPGVSLKEVIKIYSGTYPELVNSKAEFKKIEDGFEIYELSASAGILG